MYINIRFKNQNNYMTYQVWDKKQGCHYLGFQSLSAHLENLDQQVGMKSYSLYSVALIINFL